MLKKLLCLLCALMVMLPTLASAMDQPKPMSVLEASQVPENLEGQHHYLLLCVDQWTGKPGNLGNTDGIVLVTVDTRAHRVMLTSFIRDALVQRPDGGIGRINYVAKQHTPEALCETISRHIGVKVEKYILFDFSQIQKIIDFLGGVDITINASEAAYLKRYAINPTATKPRIASAGTYRFNGHAAVIYMRIRKAGGGGDFMRTQRVRTVLSTLADQCREITYEDAKALVDNVIENTTMTNMSTEDMLQAMDYAFGLRGCTIEELRIPVDGASNPINYAGMSAQEIDWAKCRDAMSYYLLNSFLVMDDEE
ncbi:MAG: LCP family protein [Clostridia bacterium]|nr:LCP family protein [Clostridia bacterium]